MIYNNNEDKFQCLAIGFRNDASIVREIKLHGASVIEFVQPDFDRSLKLLLLYKKHAVTLNSFCNWLEHMVINRSIDIILGDFNINALGENQSLINVLRNYEQIVKDSTHISGSLLDHVCIRQDFLKELNVDCKVTNVYFSDHDAVKLRVSILNTVYE